MKDSKKCSKFFESFYNFLFWFIIITILEIVFRLVMQYSFNLDSFINIALYSITVSSVLSIFARMFNNKANNFITGTILLILAVLFSLQCVYTKILKVNFSFANLALSDQIGSFMSFVLQQIIHNIVYIIMFFIPFIAFLIFKRKINIKKNGWKNYITYVLLCIISVLLFYVHIDATKNETNSTYELCYKVNEISLNIEKLGVLNSYRVDFIRTIFGFEQEVEQEKIETVAPIEYGYNVLELDFGKETNNSNIKKINEYLENDIGTQQNEFTGMFKDYNLIYITAESFYEIAIDEEITPTLYKLTHSGFVFENYYTPTVLSTIGGEFQALTGLYPNMETLPIWRSGSNYFPYGLGTVFGSLGYDTYAYHNHTYSFQNRNQYLKSQGFTNYLACYNGLEKRINAKLWPESDLEMMEATITDYIEDENNFMAYYMTVSGHMGYSFSGNAMSRKNKSVVENMNVPDEAKAYVATQVELDRALEHLINKLDEAGKLDNTVFVLLADHYPYGLSENAIKSLSSYERDGVVEINHNALIIWNSAMETKTIDKTCMSADVLPTVLNLFGVEYDSRLFTGKDILSNSEGIAVMSNYSWVTDKGTYFAKTGEFVLKTDVEIPEDYVENINSIVRNRLNISQLIIKTNYYNYLMK